MEIKRGIAVSPGVAIGPALVVDTEGLCIPRRSVSRAEVPDEPGPPQPKSQLRLRSTPVEPSPLTRRFLRQRRLLVQV